MEWTLERTRRHHRVHRLGGKREDVLWVLRGWRSLVARLMHERLVKLTKAAWEVERGRENPDERQHLE